VIFSRSKATKPISLTLTKLENVQSPLVVELGWEEESTNPYWRCAKTGKIYQLVEIKTKTLDQLIAETKGED
jgi:hypothetical protein